MSFTVIIQDKAYYSVSEVMTITGMSRPVIKKNFILVKVGGTSQKKIKLEDVQSFMDGKKGADDA